MNKFLIFITAFAFASFPNANAGSILVAPNLNQNITGTSLGGGHYGLDISGSFTATSNFSGATGSPVPGFASYTGVNSGGNLIGLSYGQALMAASLPVTLASNQSALAVTGTFWQATQPVSGTFWQATQPISAASLPLPTGASTAAKQPALGTAGTASSDVITVQGIASMTALKVDGSGVTQPISAAALPLPAGASTSALQTSGNTTLTTISGQLPATLGAKTTANSMAVNIASDQAALPLPTGASTSALQSTGNSTLSGIAAQLPATLGQKAMAASEAVVIASDQSAVPIKAAVSVTGSGSAAAATVSTVTTLSAPANAVGFILQNLDTSTANIRWAVGRTATTTLGQQLQPGRDTGFVPIGANVSIVAESGTQGFDIQWIAQ